MALVQVEKVAFRYATGRDWALQGVDLRIEPGEYIVLAGASGSGKSTLCRALNGLIPHLYEGDLRGRVLVAGLDTRHHPVADLFVHVGMVFQNPAAQLFTATVEGEIAFGLESLGLPRAEIRRRVDEVAHLLGLAHLLAREPHSLSAGEQQLVAIAAALAVRPRVLVLDEPFAHLDGMAARQVGEALRRIHREGITIVVTEHHLSHVLPDATRLVIVNDGQVVADGPPPQVLRQNHALPGVGLPTVVQAAHSLGLEDVPLTVDDLVHHLAAHPDLLPRLRAFLNGRPLPTPSSGGQNVAVLEGVGKRLGQTLALDGVSLSIREGECLAVVGANGAGKTTLIRHLNGLLRPDRGRVVILGQDTRRVRPWRLARHVGMSFQNPNAQFFTPRVRQELEAGPRALGVLDPAWIAEISRLFGLEPLLDSSPFRLSEGQKRRVAFATALAARPTIIVLDEPTAGQDAPARRALLQLVRALQERGHTIIVVTHDLAFAEACAGRWVVMAEGRIVAKGVPHALMADADVMARARLQPTSLFRLRRAIQDLVRRGQTGA